jgi:hypothetical protein
MTETFHSMAEVMARYFPNYVEEKTRKERGWIFIIPRPSVR